MIFLKLLSSIIFIFHILNLNSYALVPKEGLFSGDTDSPSVVQDTWNSVFVVIFGKDPEYEFGTASLIHINQEELLTELYFLTAKHVVNSHCLLGSKCDGRLIQDIELYDDGTVAKLKGTSGLDFKEFEIVKQSYIPDMALLKVVVVKDNKINFPKPLIISSNCAPTKREKLFAIGFSDPAARDSKTSKPIKNNKFVHKRWSEGLLTGAVSINIGGFDQDFLGTTVDALGGGSGGPIINSNGEIKGILKGAKDKNVYRGNEAKGKEDFHSVIVGCEQLNEFVSSVIGMKCGK